MDSPISLTEQLQAFSMGDREMAEAILRQTLPKLHQLAVRHLGNERYLAPVSPTELIHEVWIRNIQKGGWHVNSREHFYAISGRAMRRVLVDFARHRLALKRSGPIVAAIKNPTESRDLSDSGSAAQIVEIGLLMEKLAKGRPEISEIVDLHYFAGFSLTEISEIKGLSLRQVRHRWEKGRDWLKDRITTGKDPAR
jgi:RNA polymerase sigma factor (TIGR02999 family)